MDTFPEKEHFDRGFTDGLQYGRTIGFQDMLKKGKFHGQDLGNLLAQIFVDMHLLLDRLQDDKKRAQVDDLIRQVLEYPLDNETDETKDERLEKLKQKHKEYALIYGMELAGLEVDNNGNNKKKHLEF